MRACYMMTIIPCSPSAASMASSSRSRKNLILSRCMDGSSKCVRGHRYVFARASASDGPMEKTNLDLNESDILAAAAAKLQPQVVPGQLVATTSGGWGTTASSDGSDDEDNDNKPSQQPHALTPLQALQNPPERGIA